MVRRIIISCFCIVLFFGASRVYAQDNLQFVENKGQWHESVKFKGDLPSGLFMLTRDGYKVILHKPEDLARLGEMVHHGNPISSSDAPLASVQTPVIDKNAAAKVVLHSHQYQMRLLNANPNSTILPEKMLD